VSCRRRSPAYRCEVKVGSRNKYGNGCVPVPSFSGKRNPFKMTALPANNPFWSFTG
jgi:hypothetical protein